MLEGNRLQTEGTAEFNHKTVEAESPTERRIKKNRILFGENPTGAQECVQENSSGGIGDREGRRPVAGLSLRPGLHQLLLVAIQATALLALMGRHLLTLTFFAAGHAYLFNPGLCNHSQ